MKAEIKEFGLEDYTVISDFKGRATPLTSTYNCQATPTCIYTDAEGIIVNIMEGLDTNYLSDANICTTCPVSGDHYRHTRRI